MLGQRFSEHNVPFFNVYPSRCLAAKSRHRASCRPLRSSAERSLRLLSLLAQEGRALSLAELSVRLGLPKVTTHRLCAQLLDGGFLARDVDERCFAVGPALRRLAFDTLNHGVVRGLRHEVLAALVTKVGETCNFTTLDGTQVLYIDRVEAQWPLRLTLDVGSHVPLHCTASGKLFLAEMPAAEREALIAQLPLTRMTRHTITSAKALKAECEAIASAGLVQRPRGVHRRPDRRGRAGARRGRARACGDRAARTERAPVAGRGAAPAAGAACRGAAYGELAVIAASGGA